VSKNTKRALFTSGLVLLGGAVWRLIRKKRRDTEDRPPIVVNDGSLVVANVTKDSVRAKDWVRDGASEKWKMKHPAGKHATGYDVVVTNTSAPAPCGAGSGTEVLIDYVSGAAKYQFHFYLDPHPGGKKMEPAVNSPVTLAPNNSGQDKKTITYPAAGRISRVEVRGRPGPPCTVNPDDRDVTVTINVRY
jgi:hypothetical protein